MKETSEGNSTGFLRRKTSLPNGASQLVRIFMIRVRSWIRAAATSGDDA